MEFVDELIEARDAYERREWLVAYRALSDLDAGNLRADDFEALATTAYLLGRRNDCVQALQRAFQTNVDEGDDLAASRTAFRLALVLITGGEPAVASGWAARGERIIDDYDGGIVERGYLRMYETFRNLFTGDLAAALDAAGDATELGRRFRDPDLLAHGLIATGRLTTLAGQVPEGLRLMDEAMVGVVAGEVSPVFSGIVYCAMIEGCVWVSDFGRVVEWTRALSNWCESQPGLVAFTGQCAVHRGQLMKLHGAYADAIDELSRAAERYAIAGGDPAVGLSHQERGDVLRLVGDFAAAEEAYAEAIRFGNDSQPGRSLLYLARGDIDEAATSIRRVLDENDNPVMRNRLLPAAIEIMVAVGDLDRADIYTDELHQITESFGCAALRAASGLAAAQLALARDQPAAAIAAIRPAMERWAELSAPYELARCRVLVARALRQTGDEPTAKSELAAAHDAFVALGAKRAAREAARLLGTDEVPGGLSRREVEVLQLVAAGRTNAEIAGELYVAEKTVARHLSNIFTKLNVSSRTAAAAFAFENQLT
jgi:DNA-binding NarL/FixJ family response regulator